MDDELSLRKTISEYRFIQADIENVIQNPDIITQKGNLIMSGDILSDDNDFQSMYGKTFIEAHQEERDEYVSLMKILNKMENDIEKAMDI